MEGLVGLVQMGVLEIHPWGSRVDRRREWPVVRAFARAVAQEMARQHPTEVTAVLSKAKRKDKIFIGRSWRHRGSR